MISNNKNSTINEKPNDTIPMRLEFIMDLLKNKKLEPLVEFSKSDSSYHSTLVVKDENASGESYDTRVVLKKRFFEFSNLMNQMGGHLVYIKSGTNGHTFKGRTISENGTFEYAVKVVAYPKKEKYGKITDVRRPENAEIMMLKLLSSFVINRKTPHIVLPIGTFDTNITDFVDLIERDVVSQDNKKYKEFVTMHKENKFHKTVSILISEWANQGDLLDFIKKYYQFMSSLQWKVIIFQLLSVLATIQYHYPTFRHNDLKANNILVHKITNEEKKFTYQVIGSKYKIPNISYQIKIWDFDFACIPGIIDNKKVESWGMHGNIIPEQNRYYDVHYFFNTLIKKGFCPELMTSKEVPNDLKEFINRIVPPIYQCDTRYVHEKGRILIKDEYLTPDQILKTDPYFEEFRCKPTLKNTPDLSKFLKPTSTQTTKPPTRKPSLKRKPKPQIKKDMNLDITKFLKNDSDMSNDDNDNKNINVDFTKFLLSEKPNAKKPIKKTIVKKKHNSRTISDDLR